MANDRNLRVAAAVRCELGEGPIWHPERNTLLWFDIYARVLFEADGKGGPVRTLGFGEAVSAAALLDASSIVVAGSNGLYRVNLETEECLLVAPLEADISATRTNDCRVGHRGDFWIGTMGYPLREGVGSLCRFHSGRFDRLLSGLTTPNCIAFSPDGRRAYFSDTFDHRILVFRLDRDTGTPVGDPELFLDLSAEGLCPDGAVVDIEGGLWNAQFGAGRVARYLPDGRLDQIVELPVSKPTCPAFGGTDLKTMFVTTAWVGMGETERRVEPLAGAVFAFDLDVPGQPENRIELQ